MDRRNFLKFLGGVVGISCIDGNSLPCSPPDVQTIYRYNWEDFYEFSDTTLLDCPGFEIIEIEIVSTHSEIPLACVSEVYLKITGRWSPSCTPEFSEIAEITGKRIKIKTEMGGCGLEMTGLVGSGAFKSDSLLTSYTFCLCHPKGTVLSPETAGNGRDVR